MKQLSILFVACGFYTNITAQCVTGNCENGKGKFDFGWCTYEGTFKNGKPDGEGTMVYDDYTYVGHFTNGIENGKGIITYKKDGRKEEVAYVSGKKVEALQKVNNEEWKELEIQNVNCKSGNCNTGYGTYVFPSGNKYVGNFVNQKREGQGTFYFFNGEKFEGTFHDNEKSSGTYYFKSGFSYTGTYTADGAENNGTVTGPGGISLPYINGRPIIPAQPKPTYVKQTDQSSNSPKKTSQPKTTTQWGTNYSYQQLAAQHEADLRAASDREFNRNMSKNNYYK